MKYSLVYIIVLVCLSCSSLWAQSDNDTINKVEPDYTTIKNKINNSLIDSSENNTSSKTDSVKVETDELPIFTKYDGSFKTYIIKNYVIPRNKRHGILYVAFIIEKDGSITEAFIIKGKGLSPEYDAEAIRVVKSSSGLWTAGKINGKAVRCTLRQSLTF
jgi:hypothetical protein